MKAITLPPVTQYAYYLRASYKTLPVLQRYKWLPSPSKKCINLAIITKKEIRRSDADKFTQTTLHENPDEILKKKSPISVEDALELAGQPDIRCILIEGSPGVGKSTFVTEMCRRWDEIEALKNFSLVVLLRMQERKVRSARQVADLFHHPDVSLQHSVAKEVIEKEGAGTLLIFDGVDQLPHTPHISPLLMQILQGVHLPKATVVLTSRPTATAKLFAECTPRIDKHIEVIGFTQEEIEQHAESAFASDSTHLNGFYSYISTNPTIRNLLHIPINTAIAVEAYKKAMVAGKAPPKTVTQLCEEMVRCLLRNYMLAKGIGNQSCQLPKRLEDLPPKVYQQLCTLAQLAFSQLVKEEQVFYKLPRGCNHMGFMSASIELYVNNGAPSYYRFLHISLQEYLAAFHVSRLSPSQQIEVFEAHSKLSHLKSMWKFLAGITAFKSIVWDMAKTQVCSDGILNPFLLHCIHEAHDHVTCEAVVGSSQVVFPNVQYGEEIRPLDCYALGCCVARSACTLSLRLRLDTEMLRMLKLGLQSSPTVSGKIETLFLRPPITQQTIAELQQLPKTVIQGLDLSHCELDQKVLDSLSQVVPSLVSLKHLDIRGNPANKGAFVPFLHALAGNNSKLESLCMINTGLGLEGVAALVSLITPTGCLKELKIGDEEMPAECISHIIKTVFAPSSLTSLHLWLVDLAPHMETLSALVETNSNLTKLEFHGCKIGNEGSQRLAKALSKNRTMNNLVLSMFDVPTPYQTGFEGAVALAKMLKANHTLEQVELPFDKSLGRNGALSIANALQHNRTLNSLRLPQQYFSSAEVLAMDSRIEWSGP